MTKTSGGTDAAASTERMTHSASAVASAVAVPPLPAVEDERAWFEAWHKRYFSSSLTQMDSEPNYVTETVQISWEAWQARAALSAPAGETRAPVTTAELKALRRTIECFADEGTSDIGPEMLDRLCVIGALRQRSLIHYEVTPLGEWLALLDQAPGAQARAQEDDARDAERYRWLIEHGYVHHYYSPQMCDVGWDGQTDSMKKYFQKAVDAAIAAQAHTEKPAP